MTGKAQCQGAAASVWQWVSVGKTHTPAPCPAHSAPLTLLIGAQAGLHHLPNSPYLSILYASYLLDVQGSYQSGLLELRAAKKLDARWGLKWTGQEGRGRGSGLGSVTKCHHRFQRVP